MPLTPSRFYQIVGACTLAGIVTGYVMANQRQRHASDKAIARADSLQNAIADSTAAWTARHVQDSLTTVRVAERLARADTLQHRSAQLGTLAARLSDTIRVALPDSLRPAFASLQALHGTQVALLVSALHLQDSVIASQRGQIAWRDSVLAGVRSQLGEAIRQLHAALSAGRPRRCGMGGSGGYGVVSSGGQLRTGPAATVGITCRL